MFVKLFRRIHPIQLTHTLQQVTYTTHDTHSKKAATKKKTKLGLQDRLLLNSGQKYCMMLQGEHSTIL